MPKFRVREIAHESGKEEKNKFIIEERHRFLFWTWWTPYYTRTSVSNFTPIDPIQQGFRINGSLYLKTLFDKFEDADNYVRCNLGAKVLKEYAT